MVSFFALVGGVGQAIANPATNKLISMHVPPGKRGIITGIKQSGVQAGTFLGGLLLPVITLSFGWRLADRAGGGRWRCSVSPDWRAGCGRR